MEVAGILVLVPVFAFLSPFYATNAFHEWKKNEFPNPTRDVESCGRGGVVSWICDPDRILSHDQANRVEELLHSVRQSTVSGCGSDSSPGFQIGIAILKRMRHISGESLEETAENFARHLHDSWGVGHAECNDGVLLFLSILDRQIFVSTGKKAMEVLSNDQIDIIIEEMKPYLKLKDYGQSVELGVVRMGEVFSGKVLERPIDYGLFIFCAIFLVVVFVALFYGYKHEVERGKCVGKLKRIEEERERAKKFKKSYDSKSCPICLEEFLPETKTKQLACGHKYCEPCLMKWLKDHATCPICRQSTDKHEDDSVGSCSSNIFDFSPELQFRLMMLQLQHPSLVSQSMVNRWASSSFSGSFVSDPIFSRLSMSGGGSFGSGTTFGGGSSHGGGGRSGSW